MWMMVQTLGAQIGLLAFAIAIIAGLQAGNTPTMILTRALLAMLVGAIVGQLVGWAAKGVLRDHLQRRKQAIDQEHIEAVKAIEQAVEAAIETEPAAPPVEGAAPATKAG